MTRRNLQLCALLSLGLTASGWPFGVLHASEPLSLKSSAKLGQVVGVSAYKTMTAPVKPQVQLLGKVNLFRGVLVDDGAVSKPIPSQFNSELNVSNPKSQSAFKAVYGGLQVSLKDNLSLVYTPGRLSSTTLNSESQGLYLLTNQDGLAHWFVGVESSSYSTATDTRQTSNTAQFGIIVSLN